MDRRYRAVVAAIVAAAVLVLAGIVTRSLWPLIGGIASAVAALILAVWARKP